ncbi:MBL fold metallo-hydrolase [Nocardia rhamnosiphila]|uniref:MBL fold metallo-hydrolase n=1 Tax=Nocardia rhamnosiphila TaxID=426716 RepID=UPI00340BD9B3
MTDPSTRERGALHQVADDVWQLPLAPRQALNVYLVGDVLLDAGTTRHAPVILNALQNRLLRAHLITHAHIDHAGSSREIVRSRRIPMWVPAMDADAVEAGRAVVAKTPLRPLFGLLSRFPSVAVSRRMQEGDEVAAGFRVVDVPGHSPGHIALWREDDGVLICGDVLSNLKMPSLRPGLGLPPPVVTPDPHANRAAAVKLAALRPQLTLFGHGPAMYGADELSAFVAEAMRTG